MGRVKRVAAIDCGTNSIRLLVADTEWADLPGGGRRPRIVSDLTRQMRIVRLGEGVDRTGVLAPAAIGRTLAAAAEYKEMIDRLDAQEIRVVATSATRDAANAGDFSRGMREVLGVEAQIVPGTEEAALSFAGAVSAAPPDAVRPLLVVDIGGGSTELVLGSDAVEQAVSIDMGSVRVTEKFLAGCPADEGVPAEEEAAAVAWIDRRLDDAESQVDLTRVGTLVGVAGTITTVTAQALDLPCYQPERIDGASLPLDRVDQAVRFMVDQPVAVKAALGFMPKGREDVIAAGALVWSRVIARVVSRAASRGHAIDHTVTSEHDILDGIALSIA
jgi:exopolyphosphatase/guanosine-5'-triphosphate,3'-diphosphate pyrophosphatase